MNGAQIERNPKKSRNNRDWEGFKRPKNTGKGDTRNGTRTQLKRMRPYGSDENEDLMANED